MNIRIYVLFEAFLLRNDLAQLGERVPQSLSNNIMKLLGVRVHVIANFYDPTTLLFVTVSSFLITVYFDKTVSSFVSPSSDDF